MVEPIKLDVQWSPDFQSRTEAGFKRLQKEADGEFLRLVTPYVPKRTGALAGSAPRPAPCWAAARSGTPRPMQQPSTTGSPAGRASGRTDAAPTGVSAASMTTGRNLSPLSRPAPRR